MSSDYTPTIRRIAIWPNELVRRTAYLVDWDGTNFPEWVHDLVLDMQYTMKVENGIGLAATQVYPKDSEPYAPSLFVMHIKGEAENKVFLNPSLNYPNKNMHSLEEGCLSVPGFFSRVERHYDVSITYDCVFTGEKKTEHYTGLAAACIQHEYDHLTGMVFVDYLSELKRNRARKAIAKVQRAKRRK